MATKGIVCIAILQKLDIHIDEICKSFEIGAFFFKKKIYVRY